MIKVSILYPNKEGSKFNLDYSLNNHVPMVQEKIGAPLKGSNVEHGLSGAERDSRAEFVVMAHLLSDSVEAFQVAFSPHADSILADVLKYTDIQPIFHISEVKI